MAADDSGDEFEPFQMTEEEFLPKRRKMTKEDHIYGLWAQHDSDDEDGRYVIHKLLRALNTSNS